MKIKLSARLSAYSRIQPTECLIPAITEEDSGKLLGVNAQGNYALVSDVADNKIDDLFDTSTTATSSNDLIDRLFAEED